MIDIDTHQEQNALAHNPPVGIDSRGEACADLKPYAAEHIPTALVERLNFCPSETWMVNKVLSGCVHFVAAALYARAKNHWMI